jgi:hypothetical protein
MSHQSPDAPVQFLDRLSGVKAQSAGRWVARCPAHDDRTPSLSIAIENDGKVLLHCHAGCTVNAVLRAIGLSFGDLFPAQGNRSDAPNHGGSTARRRSYASVQDAVAELARSLAGWATTGTWIYTDRSKLPVFAIVRFDRDGKKTCRPVHCTDGRWRIGDPPGPLPLYNLASIDETHEPVVVCEGEKCCEAARSIGLTATTSAHGAKSPQKTDWSPLGGKHVIILPDNDAAGAAYADAVKGILTALQPPAQVRIIMLPDLRPGGDIVDFLDARDSTEPEALKKQILRLAADAVGSSTRLTMLSVAELCRRNPELRAPVIAGLLRQGETMNVISAPKIGKSWLAMSLALSVASGRRWLGRFDVAQGEVLYIDNELHPQTWAYRIPKVAAALGIELATVSNSLFVDTLRGRLQDIYSMEKYFGAIVPGRFKVIVIDAFYRVLPRDTDENDNGAVAALYNALDQYADRLGCCFVLIHHSTKGVQAGKSVTDVGAGAQSRATDTHLVVRQHEQDGAVVVEAAVRSWAPMSPFCLRWQCPVWFPAPELDPSQLRSERRKARKEERTAHDPPKETWTAESFVREFLTNQPQTKELIVARAVERGISARKADQFLILAESRALVYRWTYASKSTPHGFATTAQTVTEAA